jgi:hypothetical protein
MEWDRSVDWLDEPDEIDLEIIPPTGTFPRPKPDEECRAFAYLAEVLRAALARTAPEPAEG